MKKWKFKLPMIALLSLAVCLPAFARENICIGNSSRVKLLNQINYRIAQLQSAIAMDVKIGNERLHDSQTSKTIARFGLLTDFLYLCPSNDQYCNTILIPTPLAMAVAPKVKGVISEGKYRKIESFFERKYKAIGLAEIKKLNAAKETKGVFPTLLSLFTGKNGYNEASILASSTSSFFGVHVEELMKLDDIRQGLISSCKQQGDSDLDVVTQAKRKAVKPNIIVCSKIVITSLASDASASKER